MFTRVLCPVVVLLVAASCNGLPRIATAPFSFWQAGDLISAQGSFRKTGGTMTAPEVNIWKITCDFSSGECVTQGAELSHIRGAYVLAPVPEQQYLINSWSGGVLLAQLLRPGTHDVVLRISVPDKTVTRTWQGKGEHSRESLIETLK